MKTFDEQVTFENLVGNLAHEQITLRMTLLHLEDEQKALQQQIENLLQAREAKKNEMDTSLTAIKTLYDVIHLGDADAPPLDTVADFQAFVKKITTYDAHETILLNDLQKIDELLKSYLEISKTVNELLLKFQANQELRQDLLLNIQLMSQEPDVPENGNTETIIESILDNGPSLTPALNAQSQDNKHALEANEKPRSQQSNYKRLKPGK